MVTTASIVRRAPRQRSADEWIDLAETALTEGNARRARGALRRAHGLDPTSGRLYVALGLLSERTGQGGAGDPKKARVYYDRAVILAPDSALPFLYRGDLRARVGDLEGSLFDLTSALSRCEDEATREVILDARGRVLARLGRVEQAASDLGNAWRRAG